MVEWYLVQIFDEFIAVVRRARAKGYYKKLFIFLLASAAYFLIVATALTLMALFLFYSLIAILHWFSWTEAITYIVVCIFFCIAWVSSYPDSGLIFLARTLEVLQYVKEEYFLAWLLTSGHRSYHGSKSD